MKETQNTSAASWTPLHTPTGILATVHPLPYHQQDSKADAQDLEMVSAITIQLQHLINQIQFTPVQHQSNHCQPIPLLPLMNQSQMMETLHINF